MEKIIWLIVHGAMLLMNYYYYYYCHICVSNIDHNWNHSLFQRSKLSHLLGLNELLHDVQLTVSSKSEYGVILVQLSSVFFMNIFFFYKQLFLLISQY